ncbi:MAG: DUF6880 family protein [Kovacikia sp.]
MDSSKGANSLKNLLTREVLLDMAGERSFARGEDYTRRGYVHDLALEGDGLTARVSGTEEYYVELWAEEGELRSTCTCPLGVDDIFCKHCVAVGLTWLATPNVAKTQKSSGPVQKPVTMQEVQQFLVQQEKSTLIQWILDRTQRDDDWRQQLLLKVAAQRPQGLDLTTFRRALRDAISIRDFIEWKAASDYAEGIDSVLDSLKELLKDHPQAVIELCEYAIPLIETALNSVDDSNGEVGGILEELQELHLEACQLDPPDPIALADHLFQGEMDSGFGSFSNAIETYAPILGEAGIAHYRELAESMWQEFPDLSPKDAGEWNYKRRKLQRILETLAKASGDIEAVVAIKRRDLSNARTYLEIAQLYLQDGQSERALEWAESGLKAFDRPDSGLRDFVVEEYHRRGRIKEAMDLVWQAFTQSVTLSSYQKLKTEAERVKQWKIWRDKALAYIRQQLEPPKPSPQPPQVAQPNSKTTQARRVAAYPAWNPPGMFARDRSLLVEIFLWEGEADLAWKEAQAGGCSKQLWLKLAERRQQSHPEDTLPIYQREIEPLIQQTHNAAYANAVSFLQKVHDLMVALDRQAEFKALVAHLRKSYKAKRNFIVLLDKQRW